MPKLTIDQIHNFPNTTYGRALGKQLASTVVAELLEYKNLEVQVGCPLAVRIMVTTDTYIYDSEGKEYQVIYVNDKDVSTELILEDCREGFYDFKWEDYMKTWWLEKDKSE